LQHIGAIAAQRIEAPADQQRVPARAILLGDRYEGASIRCQGLLPDRTMRSMREMSVHEFRRRLREAVEGVVEDHVPLRVKRRGGQDFVVVGVED